MKFSKAPISEVIIGITFKTPILSVNDIFRVRNALFSAYPLVEVVQPMPNEILDNFKLYQNIDLNATGPILLRIRSEDKKWLCQIQCNKLYINWIRHDDEEIGAYVGFSKVTEKFKSLCNTVGLSDANMMCPDVKYYDVTYHDRIEWLKYINTISDLKLIMNYEPPIINHMPGFNNVSSVFTYPLEAIGGYGVLSINTSSSSTGKQVLRFENGIRGVQPMKTFDNWLVDVNTIQNDVFRSMFKKELLEKWK